MVTIGTVSNVTAEATLYVVLLVTEFITFHVCRKTIYPKTMLKTSLHATFVR